MKKVFHFMTGMIVTALLVSGTASIQAPVASAAAASAQAKPTDYQDHPNRNEIDYVIKNKLMWLYPDGSFKPDQPITQADLIAGLANAKGLTDGIVVPNFPLNHWAKAYYERALKDGILDEVVVDPNKVLNREEASLLLVNAWKGLYKRYQTKNSTHSYTAVASGWLPEKSGQFINGVSTTAYDGLGVVSRGEEAQALFQLHKAVNDIKVGESIATQFHNSLKVSGGILKGQVPSNKGKSASLVILFKNNETAEYRSGNFQINVDKVKYMEFTVKNSDESRSLAWYKYEKMPNTIRTNAR
ncbi:S-layer homology domain-containing protein [Brevibacillus ruminantium]|uniref:S-layer homology domain-containing protein n=1 Tax=Brevibacillus ruminantium TaxID=2950604 RepID=A0ABY4WLE4_9BACL|nr:S-layer homology domain-containing protein [Brevibacillus ruminantium]USG65471.1 S-layer homology domain-containing protein [Brevibacillus ruminantium]